MSNYGEIGQAAITIVADGREFETGLAKETDPAARRAGSRISSALGGALKKGALVTGAAVAGVLGASISKGFQRLSAIDQATAKLEGLGHSGKTVETVMKNALNSVKGTAFGLGEAATISAGLVAAGIKPGKDLEKTLKLTADSATIAGVSLNEMGAIWGKVAATGKLQGDEMAQLTERGIPILQMLAKHYGVTAAEASEMVSKGKVDFATFQTVMQGALGGAAADSGKTFIGSMKNVGAALGRLGAGLIGGVFAQMPGIFEDLIGWIDKVTPAAERLGETIGKVFARGYEIISALFQLVASGDFTGGIGKALGLEEDSFIVDRILRIRDTIIGLFNLLVKGDYRGELSRALGLEEDSPIIARVLQVRDFVIGAVQHIKDRLTSLGGGGEGGIFGAAFGGAVVLITTLAAKFGSLIPFVVGLIGPLAKLAPMLRFLLGPIGILIGLLTAAYASSATFRDGVNQILAVIGRLVGFLAAQLMPVFTMLVDQLMPPLIELFIGVADVVGTLLVAIAPLVTMLVARLVPVIVKIVSTVLPPLIAVFSALVPVILNLAKSIIPPLLDTLALIIPLVDAIIPVILELVKNLASVLIPVIKSLLPVVKTVFETVAKVISAALGIVRGIIKVVTGLIKGDWALVWSGIRTILAGVWDAIKAIITGALKIIWGILQAGWKFAADIISRAWDGIKSKLKAGWDWISRNVFDPVKKGVEAVGKAFEKAKTFIGDQWNKLKDLAKVPIKWVIDNVVNKGIIGAFNWLSDKIGGPHIDPVRVGFAKGGVFPGYTPGKDIYRMPMAGFSGGEAIMRPEWTRAVGGPKAVAAMNSAAMKGLLNKRRRTPEEDELLAMLARNPGTQFGTGGLVDWIKDRWENVKNVWDWVTDKASAIFKAVTNPLGFIREKLGNWKAGLPGPAKTITDYASAAVGKGISGVVEKVKGLWDAFRGAFDKAGVGSNATSAVVSGPITANYGQYPGGGYHGGIDWGVPIGTFVKAFRAGRVAFSGWDTSGYGNAIRIAHANGFESIYAHNSRLLKRVGDMVTAGISIAQSGSTGNSTGPHVHFGIKKSGGPWLDPWPYLRGKSFDQGGYLRPGWNLAYNGTGRPEPVGHDLAQTTNLTVNISVSIDDLGKLKKLQDFLDMLDSARVTSRKTLRSGVVTA